MILYNILPIIIFRNTDEGMNTHIFVFLYQYSQEESSNSTIFFPLSRITTNTVYEFSHLDHNIIFMDGQGQGQEACIIIFWNIDRGTHTYLYSFINVNRYKSLRVLELSYVCSTCLVGYVGTSRVGVI